MCKFYLFFQPFIFGVFWLFCEKKTALNAVVGILFVASIIGFYLIDFFTANAFRAVC